MAVAEKTQPATPSGSKYVDFDEFIEYQLRRTRNGIHQTDLLVAGIVLTCLVLGYLLVFTLFDHWVIAGGFSWIARVCLLAGLVSTVIGLGVWNLLLPYLRHINTLYAAREIERAHPELKNSLVSLIDLRRIGREVSPSILKALEKRAATEMSHADLEQAVDRRMLMRSAYVLLALVVLMGAYTLISPKKLSTSIWRALFPTSSIAVSTTTEIVQVSPGNAEVLARSQLDVTVDLAGKIPEEVALVFSTSDRRFVDETIVMRNTGEDLPRYRARLTGDQGAGLLSDVAYRIVAGDAESPTFHITVNQPPTAAVGEVRYEYPDYMLFDEKTSSSANIDAWEGTWVTVRAKANMPVTKAIIKTSDTEDISLEAEEYPMQVDGTDLTCRWQLKFRREDGTFADYYHIQLWNEKEENDPQPTVHRIKIRPDQKPEINLIHPVSDIEAPVNAVVPIVFEARDPDFMLRRVDLKLERDGEVLGTSPRLLQAPPFVSELNQTYRLKLEDYLLKPGDQLTFYIEAHDNRALIDGYGDDMTRTAKVTITVIEPQAPEQIKEFEAEQEREAQQRLLEEDPERNERQTKPQQEKQPANNQPQDGEMSEDGEAAATQDGQPGEKGAQETSDPNAAEGQTTKPSPDGNQQTQDGTNNNSDMPQEDGVNEKTEPGNNSQPREDGQPSQQNQPSGTESRSQKKQDKAAEDQALRELLEWNKRQQEKEKNQQPNSDVTEQQPQNQDQSDPSKPDQNQTSNDNSSSDPNDNKASDQKSDPNQSMPEDGANSNSSMSEDSQDGETSSMSDPTNNDSNATQPDANKPEKANDPSQNNPEKSTSDGSPSSKGQESDSMDDKGADQAQPGEVGPDAKSESGNKPPSENMKDGTGEGEKTRQAADPDTQPGEKSERGDPSENAKPSQNKNNDNDQNNENKGTQDSQDSQKPNSSDPKQTDPSMKGNESNADSQQQKSNDPKSAADQDSNPSSTDPSQSQGDPNSQSSDNPGQQPSQSDSKSSDSQSQNSKSTSQSSTDSKSSDSEPKGDSSSDQNSSSQDNSMKNEDGQSSQNSDSQKSNSPDSGKGSRKGSSDQQDKNVQDSDSKQPNQSDSDSKQNSGEKGTQSSDSKDGGQKGNQDGKQSGNESGDSQSDSQNSKPGNQMGQGSNSPTPPSSTAGGGTGRAEGDGAGTAAGDGVGPEAEAADLESKKKATSLALKRLQQQLERGETPQELLNDLGYDEQDLEKFMQRLEQRLSETAQTPESEAARRQFESLLKGIDYKSRGDVRKGNNSGDAAQGFGSGNRPVPPEFRLEQEAYKRKLSRQPASDK